MASGSDNWSPIGERLWQNRVTREVREQADCPDDAQEAQEKRWAEANGEPYAPPGRTLTPGELEAMGTAAGRPLLTRPGTRAV